MTPAEALEAAVRSGDEAAVRTLLADRPEAERAELQATARAIAAEAVKAGIDAVGRLGPVLLCAYGVLPVSDIRRLGWRSNHLPKGLEDVLRRRSPERLGSIVEYLLDEIGGPAWRVVRPLVREGIVPRPDRPAYTIAMLAGTRYASVEELLAADPGLLDVEAWRLFEVEGGGEDSLANHEKFYGDKWGALFRELAAGDPAMRRRLLDASLAALARDFSTYRAGWFSRFHESLDPTADERAERVDAYLGLLRSRVGPTVSLAVAALGRVARAGKLPADQLLSHVEPVLVDGTAGTAKAALDLVGRAGAGPGANAARAAAVATGALANASADVQRAAIGLIGRLVAGPDETVARALAGRLAEVAASQRPAAAALVARLSGAPTADGAVGVEPARSVAAPLTTPAPVPDAMGATTLTGPSPLDPARAIEPIASVDALVDLAVVVLQSGEPADDVERLLDGVGRLGSERSETFGRLTASLAKRARTILARRDSTPFNGFDARADVAGVLLAWSTREVVGPSPGYGMADPGAGAFLSARAREVADNAGRRAPFRSVAAPSHRGGWIDPAVLVERLTGGRPASRLDLVAALLRLAPDGQAAALTAAGGLAGEAGAATRYALGGNEPIGPTAAWWVAAARVRAPGVDDERVEARHPGLGPDAGQAARIELVDRGPALPRGGITAVASPAAPRSTAADLPTVLMFRDPSLFAITGSSEPAMLRWMATIQPGYREPWAAVGSALLARNVDWWSAEWANRAFLEPFIDPVTAIGPHARALLGIALGAKEAGERGLAADVVRLALGAGRLTAPHLAEGLRAAAAVACDRPNRWALALADVAATSDAHATAVADAIAGALPALMERPPAKLVPLLRAFDEILAGTGESPPPAARTALATLASSGGQAGRLARSILARG